VAVEYITQILIAFGMKDDADADIRRKTTEPAIRPSSAVGHRQSLDTPTPLVEALTPRELEVLALLDRHLTNQEIAEELVVSPSTVKTHTLNIYRKLDVHGRKQAVARATELSILWENSDFGNGSCLTKSEF
jgi:ATP/maltotriose-dependent transcriptional regulator MalT